MFCISSNNRCSHLTCSVKISIIRNFAKFTGKHLCQTLIFNKATAWPATLLKKRLWYRCFPVSFTKSKNTFFYRIPPDDCFWNKLTSISRGICLSFKSRHLELFCKIIIQLFSTGIFLGLWSRGPPCNFAEQLYLMQSCK